MSAVHLSQTFRVSALSAVFSISSFGVICNAYLFVRFVFKKNLNAFQTICLLKSLCNLIICLSFLFWVFPTLSLSLTFAEVNYVLNRLNGLIAGTAAFFLSSLLNVLNSGNRFFALQCPFGLKQLHRVPITLLSIGLAMFLVIVFCSSTIPTGCGFLFDPDLYVWRPEFSSCSMKFAFFIPYFIFSTTSTTVFFNLTTLISLMMMKMKGIKKEDADKQKKKWRTMFIQSLIQDCLQLCQIICSYFLYRLSEAIWFRFVCMTLSFLTATTLDGLVMFICNGEFHPEILKQKIEQVNSFPMFTVVHSKTSAKSQQVPHA